MHAGFLFKPNLPFMKKSKQRAPFFGLQDRMPALLAFLLGFQHALAVCYSHVLFEAITKTS